MNSTNPKRIEKAQRDLHAYHDGELGGLRRWLFERRLARSPSLRAELEVLKRVARWTRDLGSQPRSIDVWDQIALRLPAIDADLETQRRRPDERPRRRTAPRAWGGRDWIAAYARPITAAAVSIALALALFLGIMEDVASPTPGIIRWLDTGGRSVMVLEEQGDSTIVWLLDTLDEGVPEGESREAV